MQLASAIALLAFPLVAIMLIGMLRGPMGVIAAILVGWLLLPSRVGFNPVGLPPYTKFEAISLGVLLGCVMFEWRRLSKLRLHLIDVPVLIVCLSPAATSLANGLGLNDAISEVYGHVMHWGVPFMLGRAFFCDLADTRSLMLALAVAGVLCVLPCLWEMRMSPQLHRTIYGIHPGSFGATYRLGGYRPVLFMRHGIELGLWMTSACIAAIALWVSGSEREWRKIMVRWGTFGLVLVTVMCRSLGALAILILTIGAWFTSSVVRRGFPMALLVCCAPLYIGLRTFDLWYPQQLLSAASAIDEDRATSLLGRIEEEEILVQHAWQRPFLGWGSFGRSRPTDAWGEAETAVDGLWIIEFGKYGLVGLTGVYCMLLLPALLLSCSGRTTPGGGSVALVYGAALISVGFSIDSLFNAFVGPLYPLCSGAVAGFLATAQVSGRATVAARPTRACI